jgi:cell division septation protein DedD
MSNTVKKLSPFVLGLALCCYQGIQLPTAYAASFNSSSSADAALSADPAVQANTSGSTTAPSTASIDCPLQSNVSQSPLNQSANSSLQANASTSEALGVTPIPIKSDDSNSNYQSDKVANTESAQAKSDETTTTQGSTAQVNNSEWVACQRGVPLSEVCRRC